MLKKLLAKWILLWNGYCHKHAVRKNYNGCYLCRDAKTNRKRAKIFILSAKRELAVKAAKDTLGFGGV